MSDNATEVLAATALCQSLLLNAFVESYGIWHQFPFIEFRHDEREEDAWLSIDTRLTLSPYQDPPSLTADQLLLLYLHQINLQRVVAVQCTAAADLCLHFANGLILTIHGDPQDEQIAEPWTLNCGTAAQKNRKSIMAFSNGSFDIFG